MKSPGSPFLSTHRLEHTGARPRAEALGQAMLSLPNARKRPTLSPWFCCGSLSWVPPSYGKAMKLSQVCLSSQVKRHKANGKQRALHQLACDLGQVSDVSISSSVRGAVPVCDPSSPFLCFCVPSSMWHWLQFRQWGPGTPSNVFHFLPEPLGGPLALIPPERRAWSCFHSFLVLFSMQPLCTLLTPPFLPPKWSCVCARLCVCVCACARARAGAITGLHHVSSETVCRPSCVYAQGEQINISEEQYELNHFLNNKTRPHASS